MGYPRFHLVDPVAPGVYHCVSRCVRRAFLCGQDKLTGRDFEHRRQWIEDRIHKLANSFSISVLAYAVMSNHVHLVLQLDPGLAKVWSPLDVQTRYRQIFTRKPNKNGIAENVAPDVLKVWAERLGSLSWFMRALSEPIARSANIEDDCTGRFWEGRFFSQALLDDRAALAAMTYTDLNPIRARMALSLEQSKHTGVARRLANLKSEAATLSTIASIESSVGPSNEPRIKPIAGSCRFGPDVTESQYLDLVAWTSRQYCPDKASLPEPASSLKQIGCSEGEWQEQLDAIRLRWRVVGGSERVRKLAEKIGRHWFKRRRQRRVAVYEYPALGDEASR